MMKNYRLAFIVLSVAILLIGIMHMDDPDICSFSIFIDCNIEE